MSQALIAALQNPALYPHPVDGLQVIETHISWVLLTGPFAYKIKKPVNFGFLDFTSLEQRQHFCGEELRLNQRLTRDLYQDVVMDHKRSPRHFGTLAQATHRARGRVHPAGPDRGPARGGRPA